MFAIYYSLQKLHFYLYNARFTIKTDHQPLKYMFTAEQKNRRVQKWAMHINSYNCKIEYLRGDENVTADLLSRSPMSSEDTSSDENYHTCENNVKEVAVLNSNNFNPSDFLGVDETENSTDVVSSGEDNLIDTKYNRVIYIYMYTIYIKEK